MSRSKSNTAESPAPATPVAPAPGAAACLSKVPRWMAKRVAATAKFRGVRIEEAWERIAGDVVTRAFEEAVAENPRPARAES